MKGYFRKRGMKWSFTIDIDQDVTGKRKQVTRSGFETKKEAQEQCALMITELANGTYLKPSKSIMEYFLQEWLISKKTSIRESTYTSYKHIIKSLLPRIGKEKLQSITSKRITNLYNELAKDYSTSRLADVHKVFSMAFAQAKSTNEIKVNPMDSVKKPKVENKEFKVWTQEQCQTFLNGIVGQPLYLAFHIALSTGMRQSEILALTWDNINIERSTIHVVQRISRDGKKIEPYLKTVASCRQIAIDKKTIEFLQNDSKPFQLVNCTNKGTAIIPRNLMRTFYRYIKKLNMPQITFHDLRHTHATLLLQAGVNPKVVAERLGHADMRITLERYSHVLPHMQQSAAEKIQYFF
jgi:integrase